MVLLQRVWLGIAVALLAAGCGDGNQPGFPDLHPVTGVVTKGGSPVSGGVVKFTPVPDNPDFLINSEVGPDGTFSLSTVRTTDTRGERKPGVAPGQYTVTYIPVAGDQTAGYQPPVTLPDPVTVEAKANELTIELSGS